MPLPRDYGPAGRISFIFMNYGLQWVQIILMITFWYRIYPMISYLIVPVSNLLYSEMWKILMNLFKHNSTRLLGHLSAKHPYTADKVFLLTQNRENLYLEVHVHGRIKFCQRPQIVHPWCRIYRLRKMRLMKSEFKFWFSTPKLPYKWIFKVHTWKKICWSVIIFVV